MSGIHWAGVGDFPRVIKLSLYKFASNDNPFSYIFCHALFIRIVVCYCRESDASLTYDDDDVEEAGK
jgi:hypothetical protein